MLVKCAQRRVYYNDAISLITSSDMSRVEVEVGVVVRRVARVGSGAWRVESWQSAVALTALERCNETPLGAGKLKCRVAIKLPNGQAVGVGGGAAAAASAGAGAVHIVAELLES